MDFPKQNNLQWLRLLLALQVMLEYSATELGRQSVLPLFLGHFPGVPAFFFVSGFLIYSSYRNSSGAQYWRNRFLRLVPALVVVTLAGAGVVLYAHGLGDLVRHPLTYATWFLAQVTLGQAYNPGLFRDVGVGVINGSLWTITTEILFYAAVPAVVALERRARFLVPVLTGLSFSVYAVGPSVWREAVYRDKTVFDMLALTPVVWGWMFGCGIMAVQHFRSIQKYILPLSILALVCMPIMFPGDGLLWRSSGNRLGLVYFVAYAALILGFAFATPYLALKPDLSYGIYIWHMPVINGLLVSVTFAHSIALAIVLVLVISSLSWFLIEAPALRFKKSSILAR